MVNPSQSVLLAICLAGWLIPVALAHQAGHPWRLRGAASGRLPRVGAGMTSRSNRPWRDKEQGPGLDSGGEDCPIIQDGGVVGGLELEERVEAGHVACDGGVEEDAEEVEEDEEEEEGAGGEECACCCEPMTTVGVGECGHAVACGICTLRLRQLLNETSCIVCQVMDASHIAQVAGFRPQKQGHGILPNHQASSDATLHMHIAMPNQTPKHGKTNLPSDL
jgi:hypothetical protein